MEYHWPGNIRELKNVINRAHLMSHSNTLKSSSFDFLSDLPNKNSAGGDHPTSLNDNQPQRSHPTMTEQEWIADALQKNHFKRGPTAAELGMTTRTLYNKIKKYGLCFS